MQPSFHSSFHYFWKSPFLNIIVGTVWRCSTPTEIRNPHEASKQRRQILSPKFLRFFACLKPQSRFHMRNRSHCGPILMDTRASTINQDLEALNQSTLTKALSLHNFLLSRTKAINLNQSWISSGLVFRNDSIVRTSLLSSLEMARNVRTSLNLVMFCSSLLHLRTVCPRGLVASRSGDVK